MFDNIGADGVDVNAHGDYGTTVLIAAVCLGRVEHVERILRVDGIDVNKGDDSGRTPLMWGAFLSHNKEDSFDKCVAQLLQSSTIDVTVTDTLGIDACTWASYYGSDTCKRLLMCATAPDEQK